MRNGICPLCGAAEIYGSERGIRADSSTLGLRSLEIPVRNPDLMVFVCAECGHVTFQVQPTDLDDVRALVKGVKWTYMEPGQWDEQSKQSNGFHPAPARPPDLTSGQVVLLLGVCCFVIILLYVLLRVLST
jgi:hypothetical protein